VILRDWTAWVKTWSKDPQLLDDEDWSALISLSASASVPAKQWQQLTGDAVNGYGLLDSRLGIAFRVDNIMEDQILSLLAEGLELLELRDARRDFRATAWQYTFTTSMQEQDNPADFRWRCLHSDNPAANRFAGPDSRQLTDVRAGRVTNEETSFARLGRQPPRFVIQPQNVRSTEGETVKLSARAEGVPSPSYQWFTVDRVGNGQTITDGTDAELLVQNPPLGTSRYVVRASNSHGDVTSEIATLSVEQKLRLSQARPSGEAYSPFRTASPSYVKTAEDIERQRRRIESEKAEEQFRRGLRTRKVLTICGVVFLLVALGGVVAWWKYPRPKKTAQSLGEMTNNPGQAISSNVVSDPPNTLSPKSDAEKGTKQEPPAPAQLQSETNSGGQKVMGDPNISAAAAKKPSTNSTAKK
jgi:hypothetical protein